MVIQSRLTKLWDFIYYNKTAAEKSTAVELFASINQRLSSRIIHAERKRYITIAQQFGQFRVAFI